MFLDSHMASIHLKSFWKYCIYFRNIVYIEAVRDSGRAPLIPSSLIPNDETLMPASNNNTRADQHLSGGQEFPEHCVVPRMGGLPGGPGSSSRSPPARRWMEGWCSPCPHCGWCHCAYGMVHDSLQPPSVAAGSASHWPTHLSPERWGSFNFSINPQQQHRLWWKSWASGSWWYLTSTGTSYVECCAWGFDLSLWLLFDLFLVCFLKLSSGQWINETNKALLASTLLLSFLASLSLYHLQRKLHLEFSIMELD